MNLIAGSEVIIGIVIIALVWVTTRFLQARNAGKQASGLGMALGPVTVLVAFVIGVVLILNGTGLL
jgi:hypothetical protein